MANANGNRMVLTHLTTDDGLSQNTVVSVLKDRKGLMWFGTWDGLNMYDGYRFTAYKSNVDPLDGNSPLHTRVDWIMEDKYGLFWIKTYDDILYRFNPSREHFLRVSRAIGKTGENKYEKVDKVWVLNNGDVWCSLKNGGCYRVSTSEKDRSLTISYPMASGPLRSLGNLNNVTADSEGTVWLLAKNGLARQLRNESRPTVLFTGQDKSSAFSFRDLNAFLENGQNIYFGSFAGYLWNYNKRTNIFRQIPTGFRSAVTCIKKLADGRLVVASGNDGFLIYNPLTGIMKSFDKGKFPEMRSNRILDVFPGRYGEIWLSTDKPGVVLFKSSQASFSYLWLNAPNEKRSGSQQTTFFVFEDSYGITWIHTREGTLFTYDRKGNKLEWFYNKPGSDDCVFRTNIQVAWADKCGTLWICCGNQGIYKCVRRNNDFRYVSMESYIQNGTPDIRSMFRDPAGNYWISSKSGELRIMDSNFKSKGVLCSDGSVKQKSDVKLSVYKILMDRKGRIWLATKGQGLIMLTPADRSYGAFKARSFLRKEGDRYSLSSNRLYDLYEDSKGHLWIASYGGGIMLLEENGGKFRFLHYGNSMTNYPKESCSMARCIKGDYKGNIWVGTTDGFIVFSDNFRSVSDIRFYHYSRNLQPGNNIVSSDIYSILCDSKGRVWLGSFGGGMFLCKDYRAGYNPVLRNYCKENGFFTDIVLSIAEDDGHNLWVTSENTLAHFNPDNGNCDFYNVSNGLESGDFLEASVYKTSDSNLMFGNASGFYLFNPSRIKRNLYFPKIVFTGLQLFGREVRIGVKDSPLRIRLDDCRKLKLNHKQKTFSVEFAALDYQTPGNIQYEYKLEGFEDVWNNASRQRVATYTGLPKGKYTLLVRCTNSDGIWSNNIRKLDIQILPSFWETIWAYIIYVILAIICAGVIVYLLMFYLKLKNDVILEQKISDLKLGFFTDISHELRTPLTLISAPVENIVENEEISDSVREQLQVVQRNTEKMSRLINQILDFRKIQDRKKRLNIQETVFAECVRNSCRNFEEIAREQNIKFEIKDESDGIIVWIDRDAVDTIIFNLLSNAFKFTPSGKSISVIISADETDAVLKISDQGVGMEKSIQSKIFDRFYSADNGPNASRRSSGLGLSLVKELVELHGAGINVESMPGNGTTFEIRFKLGVEHFGDDVDMILEDGVTGNLEKNQEPADEFDDNVREDTQMVLVVEDNDELRSFLKTVLGRKFRVAEAADGDKAWEMTQGIMPDFIITDLMIPGIAGLDLIKLLKNDDRTCHIPVVVLTARTNMETKLECLDAGADDYITKPFSAKFLEARVSNMLDQRRRLQSNYRDRLFVRNGEDKIKVPLPEVRTRDDEFMDRLMSVMDNNISNGNFTVEQLCSTAGYGRTVFFNKLKSLTGLSPNEYIRTVRIKRAAQLLEMGDYTISQITYMVGMNDSRYFSKCFKQLYNMTPTDYREKFHANNRPANE